MKLSRRDLTLLLVAAGSASGQAAALPTKAFDYADLPVKSSRANKSRAVLQGATHSGFPIELHITELGPGAEPHPPHHHVHEELVLLRSGSLEVTMGGHTAKHAPGSIIYVASGEEHGWKNAGTEHAEYFVIALGSDT